MDLMLAVQQTEQEREFWLLFPDLTALRMLWNGAHLGRS